MLHNWFFNRKISAYEQRARISFEDMHHLSWQTQEKDSKKFWASKDLIK